MSTVASNAKPDFVVNFQRPANTEIKHISGHWYLYERTSKYDPKIKRSRKVSGRCLGKITESGLVPSRNKTAEILRASLPSYHLNDVVEVGAVNYFYQRTAEMRDRLKSFFPDNWQMIYTVVLLRTIYDARFRRLEVHYENSILSYLYPDMVFTPPAVKNFLTELGHQRDSISSYMKESLNQMGDRFVLFDGHRLLSASKTMENAEVGYDSKCRYKPQINVIYLYTLGENTGFPAYYKQYIGSTPDISAYTDILKESGLNGNGNVVTVVTDKGFASSESFEILEDSGLKYIEPLKRGNQYVSGKVPSSPSDYDDLFNYHNRAVQSKKISSENGVDIYLFFDTQLFEDEISDLASRTEKHNNTVEASRSREAKRRSNNKGRLTDEQLVELVPLTVKDVLADKQEMGTITIKTNRTDLNGEQIYAIWKQRQNIEQYFKTYDDTLDYESSYMRDNSSEEAWLFLNHLSCTIGISAIEEINSIGQSKDISLKDLIQTLRKISACRIDEKWTIPPVKRSVQTLGNKLGVDLVQLVIPLQETTKSTSNP